MRNIFSAAVAISAAAALLAPVLARGGAFRDLASNAGPDAAVVVPATRAVAADAAVALAHGELIVSGEVVDVRDAPGSRLLVSEHAPMWKIAQVKVARTLKGAPVQVVDVWFPASQDIAWAASPKFKVGDSGVWILSEVAAAKGHLTALEPSDFRAAPGRPQAASEQELIRFKDRISAPVLALSDVVGVGISADANGKPMLLIFFLTNKTSAAKVRQAALNVLPAGAAKQLQAYEAAGQLKFAPTARVEG